MSFNCAQTFRIPAGSVLNAAETGITRVDLFFRVRPHATVNRSGIADPGVTVYIVPTVNGVPVMDAIESAPRARASYTSVQVSETATIETSFEFPQPVQVLTNTTYAIVVKFDGDEDFVLWKNKVGQRLVGTTTISGAPDGQSIGEYFDYITSMTISSNSSSSSNNLIITSGTNVVSTALTGGTTGTDWRPVTDVDLKFRVHVARYSYSGNTSLSNTVGPGGVISYGGNVAVTVNATTGETTYTLPSHRCEYIAFDRTRSRVRNILVGERAYQNTVYYPGGKVNAYTLSVVANSNIITAPANGINFSNVFATLQRPGYIVITSENHNGALADVVAVREIESLSSNSSITVTEPLNFTNSVAKFYFSPVAKLDQWLRARFFGVETDVALLTQSNANTTLRFVSDTIQSLTVNAGGTGYDNTDLITVTGFQNVTGIVLGNYPASAQLVTNSSGGITAVYMSNLGCGFVNSAAVTVTVTNSSSGSSNGSGATFVANVGAIIKTELLGIDGKGGHLVNCKPINIEVGSVFPSPGVSNPTGTAYKAYHALSYYLTPYSNTADGYAYYCDTDAGRDEFEVKIGSIEEPWNRSKRRVLPSWSNELFIPYANGSSCNGAGGSPSNIASLSLTSNASVLRVVGVSNNDFSAIGVAPSFSTITFSRFIINNDYTNEHTNYGNAWAKGIEAKMSLATNATAEDVRVFATVYTPPETDIQMYLRFKSGDDSEAFEDKDWTRLVVIHGNGVYSSRTDTSDYIEKTWAIPRYPNTAYMLSGVVTLELGNATAVGINTTFSSNLSVNDAVVIANPLFPNNYMVTLVNSIANNTQLTFTDPISNNGLVGTGFRISKISYPHQAFNNILSENVVRYYDTAMVSHDSYKSCQLKIVMLSSNNVVVPRLDDIRVVAMSA